MLENVLEKFGNGKREELSCFMARQEFYRIRNFAQLDKNEKKQLELDICIEECGIYHMATLQHP